MIRSIGLVTGVLTLLVLSGCPVGVPVYVDKDSTASTPDGQSWTSAYKTIQAGVDKAHTLKVANPDNDYEVWVAEGTYDEVRTASGGTLLLADDIKVLGGFKGTESAPSALDPDRRTSEYWKKYPTIIDGSRARSGSPAYHVVTSAANAVLDGFVITGGVASGSSLDSHGGGLSVMTPGMRVEYSTFQDNTATNHGGAISLRDEGTLEIFRSTFQGNSSHSGGAIFNYLRPLTVEKSIFDNNTATVGGAIAVSAGTNIIKESRFVNNSASLHGGALYSTSGEWTVTNCILWNNSAEQNGGGMYNVNNNVTIMNSTLTENRCHVLLKGMDVCCYSSTINICNSILWDQYPGPLYVDPNSTGTVQYSCLVGGHAGTGNTNLDPAFVDAELGDLRLLQTSSALDRGTATGAPTVDIDGVTRPQGAGIDMGAHEGAVPLGICPPVRINEIMTDASEEFDFYDEDGELQPWIEIFNGDPEAVSLEGWSLTNDPSHLDTWTFPNITLESGAYLTVFASGKNRKPTIGDNLHTDFILNASGGYVALLNPYCNVEGIADSVQYPVIPEDFSYARDESEQEDGSKQLYPPLIITTPPTPGDNNYGIWRLGHALVTHSQDLPESEARYYLPHIAGHLLGIGVGYKVKLKTDPTAAFLQNNLRKYHIFVFLGHGGCNVAGGYGWFQIDLQSRYFDDIRAWMGGASICRYAHVGACGSGESAVGEQWRDAFGAESYMGWSGNVTNVHLGLFELTYWTQAYVGSRTVSNAVANADFTVNDENPEIGVYYIHYPPTAEPHVYGNQDLRLYMRCTNQGGTTVCTSVMAKDGME